MRIALSIALAAAALWAQAPGRQKRTVGDAEVARVHASPILIDTHNDITSATVAGLDIGQPNTNHSTDIPRMQKGGMGAQFFAAYVAASYVNGNHAAHRALEMIDTVKHDIVEKHPGDFVFATTADDIRRAHQQHKIAALIGIEGGHAIEDSLPLLRRFYDEGARYMTLTHANSNHWADSSGDPNKPNNGLSDFGKQVVREMNRLGMMVDISHVSDKTFWDALETSEAPIFASHSSCRAISPVPRNMTDEMIQALAKKGGVVQINFSCDFLNADVARADVARAGATQDDAARADVARTQAARETAARTGVAHGDAARTGATQGDAARTGATQGDAAAMGATQDDAARTAGGPRPRATLRDVVKHINHVVELAGVDAVGLGSDFDGITCAPEGLDSVDQWPNLTRALLEEGYTAAEIRKMYGENTLRLMTAVERVARAKR